MDEKTEPKEESAVPAEVAAAAVPDGEDENALEGGPSNSTDATSPPSAASEAEDKKAKKAEKKKASGPLLPRILSRVNIYLLAFILLIVVSLVIVFIVISTSNKEAAKQNEIKSQELTQEAIDSLTGNEVSVGDPKQLLSVESNAVFAGKVLIRDGLDVAGPIKVGGDLSLLGITVSGKSAFDEVQVNSLAIAGDTSVQGVLTVQDSLTVNGKASFAGPISAPSITIDALQLSGDIQFNRHIDAGGGTPSIARGGAVGGSGTVTISGTDTAGTVTINIGSGSGGTLATITFTRAFSSSPHVVISPVGKPAPNAYITNRTSSKFSIATDTALSGSISFDYVVID